MKIYLMFALLLLFPSAIYAQSMTIEEGKEGEILSSPLCSNLINRSNQTILGTLSTAGQKIKSGDVVKHRNNFRLAAGEKKAFCVAGPFYEGRRIELVIRTLIPLFDCKTKIDQGDIYLDAIEAGGGFKKLSATCY